VFGCVWVFATYINLYAHRPRYSRYLGLSLFWLRTQIHTDPNCCCFFLNSCFILNSLLFSRYPILTAYRFVCNATGICMHAHTHTHMYIYIYINMYNYTCTYVLFICIHIYAYNMHTVGAQYTLFV
jgi:hypothetical protein